MRGLLKPSVHLSLFRCAGVMSATFAGVLFYGLNAWTWNPFGKDRKVADRSDRYWTLADPKEAIREADVMFEEHQFLDIYELLNRLRYKDDAEVQWRVARALFKMSCDEDRPKQVRREMVVEAYDLIKGSLKLDEKNANVHKWMAIISDAKHGFDGTNSRVRGYWLVKKHMLKAIELNPNDVVVLYMLGKLCYEMSHMTAFQRLLAMTLYAAAPLSTYDEAYEYFLRAEEVEPRFYVPNLYMLGKTCLKMEMFYKARYYLDIASSLPARTSYEKACCVDAKNLSERLECYDLHRKALVVTEKSTEKSPEGA